MAQNRESYLLDRSQEFNLTTGAENRTDLTLTPNPDVRNSPIATYVLAGQTPVLDALVKVLTPTGNPIDHNYTNAQGLGISMPLPTGIYQVVASAPGFVTSAPVTVNLPAVDAALITISLTPDPRAALNTLYGLVLDQVTGNRIGSASVILTNSQGQTVATTQTDSDGEYLICETANGSYSIIAEKAGYQLPAPLTVNVSGGQIAQTNISLTPDVVTEGTVQGFIKNENGDLLGGATVGLYSVTDTMEHLIQQTFTNANGFYLFGGVVAGRYLVKAKVEVTI
ncbi:MAG: carboxypeptidase regulatory-like domain-containing protein [Desulfitobacteriaceae bacterium]